MTDELLDKLVEKLDDAHKATGIIEALDGPLIRLAIKTIDKHLLSKQSLDVQDAVIEFLEEFVQEEAI